MLTDPISDYLARVRNAIGAQHSEVDVPASRLKKEMTRILEEQGYIRSYEVRENTAGPGNVLVIQLKYTEARVSVISGLKRVSRPGRRSYVDSRHMPKVLGGMGTAILTTSKGVKTGHEARQEGVGGEVLAYVW